MCKYQNGSTVESLARRMAKHRNHYKDYNAGGKNRINIFDVFDEYEVENCKIELIENYPCNNKEELHSREGHYIQNTDCVNKRVAGRSKKQWNEDNREYVLQQKRDYHHNNRDHCLQKSREYYEKNKEKGLKQQKEYYDTQKEQYAKKKKEYREKNKEQIKLQRKEYREKNKDIIKLKKSEKIHCNCGSFFLK